MLTDRRTSRSPGGPPLWSGNFPIDMDRRVGILGLDAAWLLFKVDNGLTILDGVLRAGFDEVGEAEASREESVAVEGARILATGNWGRADVGGGSDG